jgi:glycerophosphoryl diester phosphodiesterase
MVSLLSRTRVAVIAHRGGSGLRPENTMAAFDHAIALGVDAIECDVRLSCDGEVVTLHDATLDRTTDASGAVGAFTAAQLAGVDAGARFGPDAGFPFRGRGIGVPRLAELFARHPDVPVVVEIKGDDPGAARPVVAAIRAAGASDRVVVGGFNHAVLEAVRTLAPDIPTSASQQEVRAALDRGAGSQGQSHRPAYRLYQVPYRLDGRQIFGRAFVRTARRAGLPVQAWIVDAPADMRRLVDWGVTGLITDRPDLALDFLRAERGPEHQGPER